MPGERLFEDCADITVPLTIDGKMHEAQVLVATMGVSGRLRSATGSRFPAATVRPVLTLPYDNAGPDRPQWEVAFFGNGSGGSKRVFPNGRTWFSLRRSIADGGAPEPAGIAMSCLQGTSPSTT